MTDIQKLKRIPVSLLRYGLYVSRTDRPWAEIPVIFQGFKITTANELRILRKYCRFAYVEETRSREDALLEMRSAIQDSNTAGMSKEVYARRLKAVAKQRTDAAEFVTGALHDMRLGRSLDCRQARAVVENLANELADNHSASMWLASLRRRDQHASAHAVNVCVISLAFAMSMEMEADQLQTIGLGALLHDVGKMQLPDSILSKPGPLDAGEWEMVKTHPLMGVDAVARDGDLPRQVLDIIRMHHERLDGSGYPEGLMGAAVPDYVRMVAIADAYDSLTTDQPYRKGTQSDEVLKRLYKEGGATFGAALVQRFIYCVGIFPVGSLVEMDNGALGIVLSTDPDSRLKPLVLLVCDAAGEYVSQRMLLNLATQGSSLNDGEERHIRRIVNPVLYPEIDISAIIRFEFGDVTGLV